MTDELLFRHQDRLTDPGGIGRVDVALTRKGQAHLANPSLGLICGDCTYYRGGSCGKREELMRGAPRIPLAADSIGCRYGVRATVARPRRSFPLAIDDAAFRAEIESGRFLADLDTRIATGQCFDILLADPPWRFKTFSEAGLGRSADVHYPTMELKEIIALGPRIRALAAPNCVLLLWCTWPLLARGDIHRILEAWGFEGRTCGFDWIKITRDGRPALGCGFYTRANSEPCLLAVRGKPLKRMDKSVRQIVMAPRRGHSEKPGEVHDRIEKLFGPDVRRLELFARRAPLGWTATGTIRDQLP